VNAASPGAPNPRGIYDALSGWRVDGAVCIQQ
jgi:hypothetical protein